MRVLFVNMYRQVKGESFVSQVPSPFLGFGGILADLCTTGALFSARLFLFDHEVFGRIRWGDSGGDHGNWKDRGEAYGTFWSNVLRLIGVLIFRARRFDFSLQITAELKATGRLQVKLTRLSRDYPELRNKERKRTGSIVCKHHHMIQLSKSPKVQNLSQRNTVTTHGTYLSGYPSQC